MRGKLTVRPPRLGGNERLGVFSYMIALRPNGLGLSSVRIKRIVDGVIEVVGADLMDGTPIYDVKPYISYVDSHPEARVVLLIRKSGNYCLLLLQKSILSCLMQRNLLP